MNGTAGRRCAQVRQALRLLDCPHAEADRVFFRTVDGDYGEFCRACGRLIEFFSTMVVR